MGYNNFILTRKDEVMPTVSTEPRYKQIAQNLRDQIRTGELAVGQKLPSFPQMRAQGVSQNTMEKVYLLLEADGIIERTTGSGVYVAQPRQKKAAVKTGAIGIPQWSDGYALSAYGGPILRGVQDAAYEAGYDVLLTRDFERTQFAKVDGALSVGPLDTQFHPPPTMPWVSVLWMDSEVPSLMVDEASGVRDAVRHLWRLGHRRIAYLVVHWGNTEHDRQAVHRDSLRAAGIDPDPRWVRPLYKFGEFNSERGFAGHGYLAMKKWLREDWKALACTAILAHNDEAAVGLIRALSEAGLHVPRDVSVVGFDGTNVAALATPALTTIEVPLREIGAQGTRLLLDMIENGRSREEIRQVLPVRLRIRNSTAPPPRVKPSRSG